MLRRMLSCAVFATALVALACGDDAVDPPEPAPVLEAVTCSDAATLHAGRIGNETWSSADNPHAVVDTLFVEGMLTIDAGVQVCIEPDVPILIQQGGGAIRAIGSRTYGPTVFTAGDPARPWGGIIAPLECYRPSPWSEPCSAGVSRFQDVLIEHAVYGVRAGSAAEVTYSRFRQIRCTAVNAYHLAVSRVDSAGLDDCPAVVIGHFNDFGPDLFIDNVIVGSGGVGLYIDGRLVHTSQAAGASVATVGGRIEGSRGTGLEFFGNLFNSPVVHARPIRITGGAAAAFRGPIEAWKAIWPSAADQDSLRGNGADSIITWGALPDGEGFVVPSGFVLVVDNEWLFPRPDGPTFVAEDGIRVEPGGELAGVLHLYGPLRAEGTPEELVRIRARIRLDCPETDHCDLGSRIAHADLGGFILTSPEQRVDMDRVVIRPYEHWSGTTVVGDGSVLTNFTVESGSLNGLRVGNNVQISNCVIRGSTQAGIRVPETSSNLTVHGCAFESNGGPGIENLAADTVDARFNWWGDPEGPFGPAGDGVEGNVDYSAYRTSPP